MKIITPGTEESSFILTPTLEPDYSVTVGTVTFWLPDPNLISYVGFGYLIPRTIPSHLNPHFALGVLFEHHATPEHDKNAKPGTRLTVMLGGHHWSSRSTSKSTPPEYSDAELVQMAKETLKIQLGVDMDAQQGVYAHAMLNKQCIPQHVVGHAERFGKAVQRVNDVFGPGRIHLAGTSWMGPGVSDCVEMAYQTAFDIIKPPILE
jgi:protoporphyrinogen/coproporphyrinogen III oxidase